jgi:hypothetical protein
MVQVWIHYSFPLPFTISTWYAVGLYWVPGHAGLRGNVMANELARGGSALRFVGPEPASGGRTKEEGLDSWLTSVGYGGGVSVTPKNRLKN